jgi:very-short-patch-repair endonuclease
MTFSLASYVVAVRGVAAYDVVEQASSTDARHGDAQACDRQHDVSMGPRTPREASTIADLRRARRHRLEQFARRQGGVLSREQIYAAGVTRAEVRAHVRADRWARVGRQTVCVHRGPLNQDALHWRAVFEAGPRAYLDGGSSLIAAGLRNFTMERIRVSVPRGARVFRIRGVDIRQTRRWCPDDLAPGELRRSRNEVAAIRHALWARSDREAALVLTMVVQHGLASADQLGLEMLRVRRDKRRAFIHSVLLDLLGGVRSLGELDVARECRRRGLPEPSRQVLRRGRNGKYYLDVYWDDWSVVVEIDGIHHIWAINVVPDAIRQNDLALQGNTVLRLPLLGLRVDPDAFFDQIEQSLVRAGCPIPGRRTA